MVSLPHAIVLGVVQGLTEFLPVSSTAHLRIASALLQIQDPGAAYSAVIQLGTLLALVIYFRQDLIDFGLAALRGLIGGRPFADPHARMAWFLVLGTIPVSVAGLLLSDWIEGPFRSLSVIAASLIVLALILFVADRFSTKQREIDAITARDALWIGLAQAVALIPGSSRSGTTLTMGLLRGLSRYAAMRFSFLLSVPAIGLSGVYELIKDFGELQHAGLGGLAVGTAVSALVGYATVAGLLRYLRTHSTLPFVLYRVGLGVTILVLLGLGVLAPTD